MRKLSLLLFTLLFALSAKITFGAQVSQPILVNSGNNSIFKVKITGLKSGESIILIIGADSPIDDKKPILIAKKTIKSTDLDANGFYVYIQKTYYPSNLFKPIFSIAQSNDDNNIKNADSDLDINKIITGIDCIEGVCFYVSKMNYEFLEYSIKLKEGNNISKIGIDCYAEGLDIREGAEITITDSKERTEKIKFTKKYDSKIYSCKPFVVVSGFLGIKSTKYGKEIKYPFFPVVKITSSVFAPKIKVLAQVNSGGQDYYPSFIIKEGGYKEGGTKALCFFAKKQSSSVKTITADFDPRIPLKGYECRFGFPVLDIKRELRMQTGETYSVGVMAKGAENKFTTLVNGDNFVDFVYKQNTFYPYQISAVSAEKDTKNSKVYLSATIPVGQNFTDAWFYTRMDGDKSKYKLLGDIKEFVLNDNQIKFTLTTTYPKVLIYNEKLGEEIQMPYQDGKKYVFGFCNIYKGNTICKETPGYLMVDASRYAKYCPDNIGRDGILDIAKAKQIMELVQADTGVSKYLLMAIIMNETHLGRGADGVGQCYFSGGNGTDCISRSDTDTKIFKRVCSDIGWDWRRVVVSCKQDSGSHGCAMGFTQVMQQEWEDAEYRIKQRTKRAIANPWNHCDAILGSAFKLLDDGTARGSQYFNINDAINGYNSASGYMDKIKAKRDCAETYWNNNEVLKNTCLTAGE